jgi:hypothetical protein
LAYACHIGGMIKHDLSKLAKVALPPGTGGRRRIVYLEPDDLEARLANDLRLKGAEVVAMPDDKPKRSRSKAKASADSETQTTPTE